MRPRLLRLLPQLFVLAIAVAAHTHFLVLPQSGFGT
jgi:hypothetical protein